MGFSLFYQMHYQNKLVFNE